MSGTGSTTGARRRARLALADGAVFDGWAFGHDPSRSGPGFVGAEVVFQTGMTGYQEVVSDPSYRGQIVVMTAPHIGNVGINALDAESDRAWAAGLVVRELCRRPSSWRAERDLESYLTEHGVVGMEGLDTRALVRQIRDQGAQMGVLAVEGEGREGGLPRPAELVERARALPGMEGADLVREVTCAAPYAFEQGTWLGQGTEVGKPLSPPRHHVVVYDFGVKRNQLRLLVDRGCRITVVPATTPAEAVLDLRPDGVLLSNGPGDPAAVGYGAAAVRGLLGRVPLMGVCLGHQILALALGARTYKLRFGHHGNNQPVLDVATGRVAITSHNHGFAVDAESLQGRAELTHLNLNDRTVEGLAAREARAFSVQYHPEAAPGPHDAVALFERFLEIMDGASA